MSSLFFVASRLRATKEVPYALVVYSSLNAVYTLR